MQSYETLIKLLIVFCVELFINFIEKNYNFLIACIDKDLDLINYNVILMFIKLNLKIIFACYEQINYISGKRLIFC